MINESQKSQGKMGSYKEDLYLLRMEMQKKLSSIEQEIELQELKASQFWYCCKIFWLQIKL